MMKKNIIECVKGFCLAYLHNRDAAEALKFVSDDVTFIGTAAFERSHGKENLKQYLLRDIAEETQPFDVSFDGENVIPFGENGYLADVSVKMSTATYKLELCLAAAVRAEYNELLLCHINFSIPTALQKEGEHYPLTLVHENLNQMREKMLNDSIAGGMMGGYNEPGFPFYFVNESMLKYLGYESEKDFIADIEGYVSNCMHPDDRERVNLMVEQQLRSKESYEVEYRMRKKDGSYLWVHDVGREVETEENRMAIMSVCYDITEKILAEEALQKSEMTKQIALDASEMEIWIFDLKNKCFQSANQNETDHQFGEALEGGYEAVVQSGLIMKESVEEYLRIHREIEAGKSETEAIIHMSLPGSRMRWQKMKYVAVRDENGQTESAIGVGEDVTALMEAQARFNEEVLYSQTFHSKNLASCKINLTKNVLYNGEGIYIEMARKKADPGADDYFRLIVDDISVEKQKEEYNKRYNRQALLKAFNSGNTMVQMESTRKLYTDHTYQVNCIAYLMKNPDTHDVICFLYTQDMTHEKMLQNIMDTIVKTDYEFAVVIDGEKGSTVRYSAVSPETCMFPEQADSYEEVVRKYFQRKISPEEAEKYSFICSLKNIEKELEKKQSFRVIYSRMTENGTILSKQLNYSYINRKKKELLCTRTDVTGIVKEQKEKNLRLETALRAAEKANRAKTDFLSRMSHDIRTPMNAIIGMTEIARYENPNPQVAECLEKIDGSSKFLLGLINDILDITKIESGKFKLTPDIYRLPDFDLAIDTIIRPLMEEKEIDFQYKMLCGATCVYVDRLRFNQIFFNLLSNAVKFTPERGTVIFSAIHLGNEGNTVYVRFMIEDNGIGMSEEFVEHAFEPFEQENNGLIAQFQGTGLGLAIVNRLVKLMDGKLYIESRLGKGTKITVDLPLVIAEIPADSEKKVEQIPMDVLKGKHVLLAEDNKINTIVATKLLERAGVSVDTVENGKEAVDAFFMSEKGFFDGILMDIKMPVMDGLEAARRIRELKREDAQSVPIIALSANAYEEDVLMSKEAGMNMHLSKPVEPAAFYRILANQIGN